MILNIALPCWRSWPASARTLTLPGIAGIVLTVGMAVDANIIIYERIREELRAGNPCAPRSTPVSQRAFWTASSTRHSPTFVAGVVLYSIRLRPDPRLRGHAAWSASSRTCSPSYWLSHWMFDAVVGRRGVAKATLSI